MTTPAVEVRAPRMWWLRWADNPCWSRHGTDTCCRPHGHSGRHAHYSYSHVGDCDHVTAVWS